jgi:hypothetical protein
MGAKRFSSWGMPNVPKKSMMGQSIWLLQKKKSCEHTHELINMNPTIYIIDNNVGMFSQYIQN